MGEHERMYKDLAWTWPIISPPGDYASEAGTFISAIESRSKIPVNTLLDLGCGGGHNDFHLKKRYRVTGLDISEGMLLNAGRLNPGVEFHKGDMRSANLGKMFDSVIIADAIMYMLDEDDLLAAFANAYRHLRPGGVFCTYVEELPDKFKAGTLVREPRTSGDTEITLIEHKWDPDQNDTRFEMLFIYIIREGRNIRVESDRHTCGIFPLATWERLLREVGFIVETSGSEDEDAEFSFTCLKPVG